MTSSASEIVLPYFFEEGTRRLYGCYHAVESIPARDAVLICHATAHEYERTHRAMRQLAVQLARAGYGAMRFDYSGTGDSSGEYGEATIALWRRDIVAAAAECLRRSRGGRLCLAGVRMGATMAAQAAAEIEAVTQLVLYAPVIDARSLLCEWRRDQENFDRKFSRVTTKVPEELLGFPLTDAYCAELEHELVPRPPSSALRRVLILADRPDDQATGRLADILGSRGATVTVDQADGPPVWRREPLEAIVPFKVLRRIIEWVQEAEC